MLLSCCFAPPFSPIIKVIVSARPNKDVKTWRTYLLACLPLAPPHCLPGAPTARSKVAEPRPEARRASCPKVSQSDGDPDKFSQGKGFRRLLRRSGSSADGFSFLDCATSPGPIKMSGRSTILPGIAPAIFLPGVWVPRLHLLGALRRLSECLPTC